MPVNKQAAHSSYSNNLFRNGGQMGDLMQAYNWDSHPLGNPKQWPQSLKNTIRLILSSDFPMFIWWSRELYMFHNDSYLPALGKKHPQALGAKAPEMWAEIWWQIGDIVERILSGGDSFYADELQIVLERKGFLEETYWTFSYSAAPGKEDEVDGIFCACHEVTAKVLGQRRLQTIKAVSEAAGLFQSMGQASQNICSSLTNNAYDIPFGLLYLCNETEREAQLAGYSGELPQEYTPFVINLNTPSAEVFWPLAGVKQSRNKEILNLPPDLHTTLPGGPWPESPTQAVILPLFKPSRQHLIGFLIAGVSPKLEYDTDYQGFHELLARQISTTLDGVQARAEAEQQRNRLESLFMEAPAPICILDGPDFTFQLVNPAYQSIFEERELLGKPLLQALPEVEQTPIHQIIMNVYHTGKTFVAHEMPVMLARRKDEPPEEIFWTFTYQARRNGHGETDGIVVFAYEVTDQVLARRDIEKSAQRFRLLLGSIPQMAWTAEKDGKINYFNEQWFAYTGQTPEQAVSSGWQKVTHPEDLHICLEQWQHALQTQTTYQVECRYLRAADKSWRWHLTRAIPLTDGQGELTLWVGTCTDIHEQKLFELKLQESERYFRMMADHVPVMIWVTGPDGMCTYLNKQWYAYTGQTEAEALGFGWLSATHPDDAATSQNIFLDANQKQTAYSITYRLRTKAGNYRWAVDMGSPKFSALGEYEGFIGVVIDIHERKLAEEASLRLTNELSAINEELIAANEKITASNEEMGYANQQLSRINADMDNFIYTASHDLKAPISNIEGLLYTLVRKLPEEFNQQELIRKLIQLMEASVERFKKTLNELTNITRLQKEANQAVSPVYFTEIIEEVCLDMDELIKASEATLEINVADCPLVHFSPKNLRSIIYNLLSNAIKYRSPERKPLIRIFCRQEPGYVVLTVQDNGLGMQALHQDKIFGMFQRLHDHVEGTGVGLYIVKRMLDNAGGKIEVESQPGVGSTFKVYFNSI